MCTHLYRKVYKLYVRVDNMGRLQEARQEGIKRIFNTLKKIDDWNYANPQELREVDKEKMLSEIMLFYQVSSRTAKDWFKEAMRFNSMYHDDLGRAELRRWSGDGDKNHLQDS